MHTHEFLSLVKVILLSCFAEAWVIRTLDTSSGCGIRYFDYYPRGLKCELLLVTLFFKVSMTLILVKGIFLINLSIDWAIVWFNRSLRIFTKLIQRLRTREVLLTILIIVSWDITKCRVCLQLFLATIKLVYLFPAFHLGCLWGLHSWNGFSFKRFRKALVTSRR